MQTYIADRITVNPKQWGGRPCIRGMQIRVVDVLDLMPHGLSFTDVLEEMPVLEMPDLLAALKFATKAVDHPVLVSA